MAFSVWQLAREKGKGAVDGSGSWLYMEEC